MSTTTGMMPDSRTPVLPRVGAKIRVTETHISGAVSTFTGHVTEARLNGDAERVVNLENGTLVLSLDDLGGGWTVEVEELVPPCPPEPRNGVSGQAVATTYTVWVRSMYGWHDAFEDGTAAPLTWVELYDRHPEVKPLVAAPLLAELVDTVRSDMVTIHERAHEGYADDCRQPGCTARRALLDRVQAGAAA